jgi:spore germination cell wall hydrolase CwlJ-like protein
MKLLRSGLIALVVLLSSNFAQAGNLAGVFKDQSSIDYQSLDVVLRGKLDKELKCLANNIYYEAGSEPFEGKVAVAMVSLNRAESGKFPNTICGVVSQRTVINNRVICQFSWFCSAKRNGPSSLNQRWEEAMEVARMVLVDGYRIPALEDAMYFHATHVRPNWGQPKVAKIGNHVFYADKQLISF